MSNQEIERAFVEFESENPQASTERLLEMTADYCKCSVDEVAAALAPERKHEPTTDNERR